MSKYLSFVRIVPLISSTRTYHRDGNNGCQLLLCCHCFAENGFGSIFIVTILVTNLVTFADTNVFENN